MTKNRQYNNYSESFYNNVKPDNKEEVNSEYDNPFEMIFNQNKSCNPCSSSKGFMTNELAYDKKAKTISNNINAIHNNNGLIGHKKGRKEKNYSDVLLELEDIGQKIKNRKKIFKTNIPSVCNNISEKTYEDLTVEEDNSKNDEAEKLKQKMRLLKNRLSAKKCRENKKKYFQTVEFENLNLKLKQEELTKATEKTINLHSKLNQVKLTLFS